MYCRKVNILKDQLAKTEHVALTSDLWTSKANEACITITSHFLDENYKLRSYVLETIGYDQDHTGNNLSTYFVAATGKWEIDNKINPIVTDNASNITNAVEFSGYESLRCAGHTLNLCVNDIIDNEKYPKIEALLIKCRKIVAHFKRSAKAQNKMIKIHERLEIKQHKMIQEVFVFLSN